MADHTASPAGKPGGPTGHEPGVRRRCNARRVLAVIGATALRRMPRSQRISPSPGAPARVMTGHGARACRGTPAAASSFARRTGPVPPKGIILSPDRRARIATGPPATRRSPTRGRGPQRRTRPPRPCRPIDPRLALRALRSRLPCPPPGRPPRYGERSRLTGQVRPEEPQGVPTAFDHDAARQAHSCPHHRGPKTGQGVKMCRAEPAPEPVRSRDLYQGQPNEGFHRAQWKRGPSRSTLRFHGSVYVEIPRSSGRPRIRRVCHCGWPPPSGPSARSVTMWPFGGTLDAELTSRSCSRARRSGISSRIRIPPLRYYSGKA